MRWSQYIEICLPRVPGFPHPPPLLQLFKLLGRTRRSQQTSALCECPRTVQHRWSSQHAARRLDTHCRLHVADHGDLPHDSTRWGTERAGTSRPVVPSAHRQAPCVPERYIIDVSSPYCATAPRVACPMTPLCSCTRCPLLPRREGSLQTVRDASPAPSALAGGSQRAGDDP